MEIFNLFGSLSLRGGDRVENTVTNIGNKLSGVGKKMLGFGTALTAGITLPIIGLAKAGIDYNATNEMITKSLETLLGSEKDAINMTGKLKDLADKAPFQFSELAETTKKLLAYGIEQDKVLDTTKRLGDVSLGNKEAMEGMGIALAQVAAKGKLQTEELYQLQERGWNPLDEIMKKTGETQNEVRKRIEKGKVTYDEVADALKNATDKGGKFYKGMENASETFSGQISILKSKVLEVLGDVTKPLFDFLSNNVLPVISDLAEKFKNLNPVVKTSIGIIALLLAGLGPLIIIIGSIILGIGTLVTAIGTIGLPILAVIGGIGVLIAEWVALGAVLTTIAVKTGILQWAFENIKSMIMSIVSIFQGNVSQAFDLLTNKFGMSTEQANWFINKIVGARDALFRVGEVIKNVTALLGAIFTADKQKMIDLLMKKFGFTKDEAKRFSDKVEELRDKIIRVGNKMKEVAAVAIAKFADMIKLSAQFVYDHRKEIALFIEKVIDMGLKIGSLAKTAYEKFKEIKKNITDTMDAGKKAIDKVVGAFNSVKSVVGGVIDKLKSLKFPSPPKWLTDKIPGFATGVRNFGGGLAVVGESGPELLYLPKNSTVFSNQDSKQLMNRASPFTPGNIFNSNDSNINNTFNVTVDLSKIRNLNDLMEFLNSLGSEYATR